MIKKVYRNVISTHRYVQGSYSVWIIFEHKHYDKQANNPCNHPVFFL